MPLKSACPKLLPLNAAGGGSNPYGGPYLQHPSAGA
jgi:hypothetical protein